MMNRDLIRRPHSIIIREVNTMQVQILQQLLEVVCPRMHRVRRASLAASVLGALRGRRLTVTAIGRALPGGTSQKHAIKRATGYYRIGTFMAPGLCPDQRVKHYQGLCRPLIGARTRPVSWWIGRTWMRANALSVAGECGGERSLCHRV